MTQNITQTLTYYRLRGLIFLMNC